jgi:hypothetical protein
VEPRAETVTIYHVYFRTPPQPGWPGSASVPTSPDGPRTVGSGRLSVTSSRSGLKRSLAVRIRLLGTTVVTVKPFSLPG